ncbi:tRNA dimethylallyltransferase-like [Sycon ciliatum]|uniref:tRNA dimethylallyltransferase-like n=1 Tax=Sycon ciliatum TaxID=27933 RepID=UPI0020A8513B|eukprot:scpid7683/ scgid22201/ tRNA dimethylallyltransferase; Dimethylallyl diphosphate:tRNA dimethylallyltransferase; Isopentenyl-diphosphate:tRNA isopentenyltransferase
MALIRPRCTRFDCRRSPVKWLSTHLRSLSTKNPEGKTKVLVITGPTAVGKTGVSLDLARFTDIEIISADAVQVYRGLDIGSDKVSDEVRARVPHHAIDVADLDFEWPVSVGTWVEIAHEAIESITAKGRIPVVAGGSWFYARTLLRGQTDSPATTKEDAELAFEQMRKRGSYGANHAHLMTIDPVYARSLGFEDWKKMERAFIVYNKTGRPVSSFSPRYQREECPYDFRCFCVFRPGKNYIDHLYDRCEQIVYAGLIEETYWAVLNGLDKDCIAAKAVGYRQALPYIRDNWLADDRPTDRKTQIKRFREFLGIYKQACRSLANEQRKSLCNLKEFEWIDISRQSDDAIAQYLLERYNTPVHTPSAGCSNQWEQELRQEPVAPAEDCTVFFSDSAVEAKLRDIESYLTRDPHTLPHPKTLPRPPWMLEHSLDETDPNRVAT